MGFEVEIAEETRARVRVTVAREEIQAAVSHEMRHVRERARIPGFRPGKVPRRLLEKRVGGDVEKQLRRRLFGDALRQGLVENRIHPVDFPPIDDERLAPGEDGSVRIEFELDVIPHVEPAGFERFSITPPPFQITDADVEREIEGLRRQAATAQPIADGLAAEGDVVVADLALSFLDGTSLPNRLENRIIDTGAGLVDGVASEDARTKFAGCRRGDVVRVSMRLPADFPVEAHRDQTAITDCTVKDVRRIELPEAGSPEFLERVGAADMADVRARVRAQLERLLRSRQDRAVEEMCIDQLLERNRIVLPDSHVQRLMESERERIRRESVARGVPPEEIERQLLENEGRIRIGTERRVREAFLLDRIGEKLEVEVSPQELEQQFLRMAEAWQVEPQKLYDHFESEGMIPRVVDEIRRAKVRRQLREAAAPAENPGQTRTSAQEDAP